MIGEKAQEDFSRNLGELSTEDINYDPEDVLSNLADFAQRYPSLTLRQAVGVFRRQWILLSGESLYFHGIHESPVSQAMFATLEYIGLAGDQSYTALHPQMLLRDYLCLIPSEMLPEDYMY